MPQGPKEIPQNPMGLKDRARVSLEHYFSGSSQRTQQEQAALLGMIAHDFRDVTVVGALLNSFQDGNSCVLRMPSSAGSSGAFVINEVGSRLSEKIADPAAAALLAAFITHHVTTNPEEINDAGIGAETERFLNVFTPGEPLTSRQIVSAAFEGRLPGFLPIVLAEFFALSPEERRAQYASFHDRLAAFSQNGAALVDVFLAYGFPDKVPETDKNRIASQTRQLVELEARDILATDLLASLVLHRAYQRGGAVTQELRREELAYIREELGIPSERIGQIDYVQVIEAVHEDRLALNVGQGTE